MKKNKKILIVVVGLVLLALIGALFVKLKNEWVERETIAQEKDDLYYEYIDFLEGLSDNGGNLIDNAIEVIDVSGWALANMNGALSRDGFAQKKGIKVSKKGNEYLEKLEEIALENLNESINYVLSNDDSGDLYKEIRYSDSYANEENKLLLEEAEKKLEKKEQEESDQRKAEWEAEHGISWDEARAQAENTLKNSIQTGMSGSEVRKILGSPNSKHTSSEAEFWTYGNMVLTMKNGFVFQINNND